MRTAVAIVPAADGSCHSQAWREGDRGCQSPVRSPAVRPSGADFDQEPRRCDKMRCNVAGKCCVVFAAVWPWSAAAVRAASLYSRVVLRVAGVNSREARCLFRRLACHRTEENARCNISEYSRELHQRQKRKVKNERIALKSSEYARSRLPLCVWTRVAAVFPCLCRIFGSTSRTPCCARRRMRHQRPTEPSRGNAPARDRYECAHGRFCFVFF